MHLIKQLNHNDIKSFFVLLIIFFFHLYFLDLYPVNDEFIFPLGAKLLENLKVSEIRLFFNYNANTLGFSILIYFFSKILPFDYYTIGKLLSSGGLLLIYFGVYALFNKLNLINFRDKYIIILLILLNPLVFIFSFRSTPDFFSAALSFYSIVYFLNNRNFFFKLFFIILFSIAVIIKPFNAILILLIFSDFNYQSFFSKKNLILFIWSLLSFIAPFFYFLYNYNLFNFFLIPKEFNLSSSFNFKDYFISFVSYIGFFNLFLITLYLDLIKRSLLKNLIKIFIFIFISFIFSYFLMQDVGELNFGFIHKYLNPKIYFFIITLSFLIFCDFLLSLYKIKNSNFDLSNFIFLIIIFFIIMSNFQPTQRYLLTILPLSLFFIFIKNGSKFLQILTIIIYLFMNIPLVTNHYYTSKNIENVIMYLNKNDILYDTHPGFVGQHSLNLFINFDNDISVSMDKKILFNEKKKYIITDLEPKNKSDIVFISKSNNIFKKNKNLYLIKKK